MDPTNIDSSVLDEVIPIVFALVIGAIVICAQWLIYRLKKVRLEAMKQAIVARPDLDPEEITALLGSTQSPRSDTRRAMLAFALGCAFLVSSLWLEGDLSEVLIAITPIPMMIGACHLVFAILRLQSKA